MGKEIKKAVAYLRTSSRTNVGADKDSDKRQRADEGLRKSRGLRDRRDVLRRSGQRRRPRRRSSWLRGDAGAPVEQWRADDHRREPGPLRSRPHGATRGPRPAQGEGNRPCRGFSAHSFHRGDPTAVLVRQVLGGRWVREDDLVAKLAASRRRKRMATGKKVEGRKSHVEARPDLVKLQRRSRARSPRAES